MCIAARYRARPGGIPGGLPIYAQYWIADPGGPHGFAASNALVGTTEP